VRRVALLIALAFAVSTSELAAQTTSATIQGTVSDDTGVLPGATVTARESQSGFQFEAVTGADGSFALGSLRPGTYEITVTVASFKPQSRTVQVLVGQTVTVNFKISPDVVHVEEVTVVGQRLVDTRTPEITTNVTEEQVRYLPQNSRNFLNFAALAPGVRLSTDEFRQEVTAGSLAARNTNVFIDGVSYKNDVIEGGVIGQDASRGNPFPQNAVQEFQVVTQNYKAEYEKASSAIVSAVTKSGGNRFTGDFFNLYQDKHLVENEAIVRNADDVLVKGKVEPKPVYERWQWGASLGGPIVRDRAQFFGAYEENRQDRASQVILGTVTNAPQPLIDALLPFEGTFTSPFREKLLFLKGTFQPTAGQSAELTYNWRNETDIRGFGNQGATAQTSFQSAENIRNRVDSVLGKYQVAGSRWLNEAFLSYQRYRWNPMPENPDLIGQDFDGLMRVGGKDTTQLFVQERISLRDDVSRFISWKGSHTVRVGGVLSFLDYNVQKELNGNPVFRYRSEFGYLFPHEASYGTGNPDLSASNRQFGFYAQDDWIMSPRFTLNVGLRWDYESDMLNNDYVTPDEVRTAAAPFVDPNRYFTDGDDRSPFFGAWQPRVGFSYDLTGAAKTILFGGYGRYYDRVLYNHTLDERFRLQYAVRTFRFSPDGLPRDGQPTIIWDNSLLSKAALDGIIASGQAPTAEVFLIDNEQRPPLSDQWTIGVRHSFGNVLTSVSYAGVRSKNEFTWLRGNRRPDGTCCLPIPGFANLFVSTDAKRSWFDGLYVQAEKPYGAGGGRWGFSVTYTLGRAEQNGGDTFSLDFPTVEEYGRYPTTTDERHRVVATGIVGLPYDFIASAFLTLGSGTPYDLNDESQGGGPNERVFLRNGGRPEQFWFIFPDAWAYRSLDLRLEKMFRFATTQLVSVAIEAFNVFSYDNFADYDGFQPTLPATNPNFGRPRKLVDPGRRLQFGVRYGF
jgi:Carboxypeptidase regulatory-like domain/TonB dependent receptor